MPDNPATVHIKITPPGETEQHDIEINLMAFTLAERNTAKKALAKFTEPDMVDIMAVNAWVVWRRSHPECSLDDWVNGITFGDLLGTDWAGVAEQPYDTPEDYSPET